MQVEVSPETAEILFRVLTEKKENFELKEKLRERVAELEERNAELERLSEYGENEWRLVQIKVSQEIHLHASSFFPEGNPPESYTFSGKVSVLIQALKKLEEHRKINERDRSIVLALGAIDKDVKFVVHYKIPGQGVIQKEGKILNVRDSLLYLSVGKPRKVKERGIPITSIVKIELAEGEEDKKK